MAFEKTVTSLSKDMSEKGRYWFNRQVWGSLCENLLWNVSTKLDFYGQLNTEIKELLRQPDNEVRASKLNQKVATYDETKATIEAFEKLLDEGKATYHRTVGEEWKRKARNGVDQAQQSISDIRKRFEQEEIAEHKQADDSIPF